jgi:transposase
MSSMTEPARPGGEFFTEPTDASQRRYEALRAYLVEGMPAEEVAARFGYTTAALYSAVRDFRAGRRDFFTPARPGPKSAPAKDAARARVLALRVAGHSIDEISAALAAEGTPLNRTGVAEICAEAGLPRLWRRPEADRGGPRRATLPRARRLDWASAPQRAESR